MFWNEEALERVRGEEVIIAREQRDSSKGWGQECSSVSQGHRYFMAFTFLHDTSDAQNRQSSIALFWGGKPELACASSVPCSPLPGSASFMGQNSGCDTGFLFARGEDICSVWAASHTGAALSPLQALGWFTEALFFMQTAEEASTATEFTTRLQSNPSLLLLPAPQTRF